MVKTVSRYNGDFVECANQIAQAGQRMATAREGMQDRITDVTLKLTNSNYFSQGGWYSEGTARINGVNHWCLGKYAPTTNYAQETLDANKAGTYLALTEAIKLGNKPASEVIQMIAEADAKKPVEQRRILIPTRQETFSVPSESLGDVDIARFLARDAKLAQDYGQLVKNVGIKNVIFYQLSGDKDIAAGFWLYVLGDGGSGFDGDNWDFDDAVGSSFGVRSRARSASASVRDASGTQNFSGYSTKLVGKVILAELADRRVALKGFKESVLERLAKLK